MLLLPTRLSLHAFFARLRRERPAATPTLRVPAIPAVPALSILD